MLRFLFVVVALALGPAAYAQVAFPDSLDWERVGDRPLDAALAFDATGALWGIGSDFWRLPPGGDTWEEVADRSGNYLLALSPDTLLYGTLGSVYRSLDAGQTWALVYDGGGPLLEGDPDGPSRGVLLTGVIDNIGIAYSLDRGATWQRPSFPEAEGSLHSGKAFGEVTAGPHAGRLLSGHLGGLGYSDDAGRSWRASNLWSPFEYVGESFASLRDGTVLAGVDDAPPGGGLWASEDGAAWTRVHAFFRPNGMSGNIVEMEVAGGEGEGEVVYAVEGLGHVFGSGDGGQTWAYLGRVYDGAVTGVTTKSATMGPDGRLYVSMSRTGPEKEWVYRTVAPVPVGVAPGAPPAGAGSSLRVWPNPARGVLHVEGAAGAEAVFYDVLGREVLRVRLGGVTEVDVSGLLPGVYVVRAGAEAAVVTVVR